jgi:hypothetical protein
MTTFKSGISGWFNMKYRMTDADKTRFEIGYQLYNDEPLLWLESSPRSPEVITLHLKPIQLRRLINKLEKLCTAMEKKL